MTVQFSEEVRNAAADIVETTIGASPKLRIIDGAIPANCAAAQAGTVLAEITCPADWLGAAVNGVKALAGAWTVAAAAAGTAQYYRLYNAAGTTCHEQGDVTATGGGGAMTLDNTNIAAGQTVTITAKTLTASGA